MIQPAAATPEDQHRPLEVKRKAEAIPLLSPYELPDHTAFRVPLRQLSVDASQPRKEFDQTALDDLAKNIAVLGVVNPLTVRRTDSGLKIIAGERRYRAAQLAGLAEVPVHIITDEKLLAKVSEMQLVENLHREDLNPYDEAVAFARLRDEKALSTRELAAGLNLSKSTIARKLKVLEMPQDLQDKLRDRTVSLSETERLCSNEKVQTKTNKAQKVKRQGRPPKLFRLRERKEGGFDISIQYRPDQHHQGELISKLESLLTDLKCKN